MLNKERKKEEKRKGTGQQCLRCRFGIGPSCCCGRCSCDQSVPRE